MYFIYILQVCFGIPILYFCDNFEYSIGFYYASACHEFSFIMITMIVMSINVFVYSIVF